jgi:signal transduction histidine kinase
MVNGDKSRIGQVIINLVTNAIKYSPDSDCVDIICAAENGKVLVSITDYGIGIPKEKQSKIFDRFYRVDTLPKEIFKGLGLGLYITAEIIKRHNGAIGVESSEGSGSTFWFTLPQN